MFIPERRFLATVRESLKHFINNIALKNEDFS